MNDETSNLLRLAGAALAHAVWSVEDGETLCTMAMVERSDERELVRYEAPSIPESVEIAHADLGVQLADGGVAALVIDGYATADGGARTDALIVQLLGPGSRPAGTIVQPYRAARRSRIPFVRHETTFELLGDPMVAGVVDAPDADRIVLAAARDDPNAGRHFS